MNALRLTSKIFIFVLPALVLSVFPIYSIYVEGPNIGWAAGTEENQGWFPEITKILGCYCGCDLTLSECEEEDPDCRLRPMLKGKLVTLTQLDGPSLTQVGGCTCGCGYTLADCREKHQDCTQRPRIYQQLKRLAVRYGIEETLNRNSELRITDAEKKIFEEAKKNRSAILYVYKHKNGDKSRYMKKLLEFQKKNEARLAVIPVSPSDVGERSLLKYYRIDRPSVLMVAPNGAVTAFFKGEPKIDKLKRGLVSPKMAEILLAIQTGMTTFLYVGKPDHPAFEDTKHTISQAVHKLGGIAIAISVDPDADPEKGLITSLKYKRVKDRVPVFVIAPTGLLIERIETGLTERRLFDSFQRILAMNSGCGQSTITGGSACQPGYGVTGESSCQ